LEIDHKWEQYKHELENQLQINKTETLLLVDDKKDEIEKQLGSKIQGNKVLWSDFAKDLSENGGELNVVLDKRIDNKMCMVTEDLNTVQNLIKDTKTQAKEERDREARRNNIVIFRVPESKCQFLQERTNDDTKMCLKFFNEVMQIGVDKDDILKVVRLGRFQDTQVDVGASVDTSTITRPLLVMFSGYGVRNLIMNSLYKLKSAAQQFRGFIVSHDMTELERLQCKEKVDEAKSKTSADISGDFRYVVRGMPGYMEVMTYKVRHK
jgi:hypothetical protein